MKRLLLRRINSDNAFMGPTHALSAVAAFLLIVAFLPGFALNLFGPFDLILYITACLITVSSALLPDFDNVQSTAISVLGPVGVFISKTMRSIAKVIYGLTRGKYDKPGTDPHRGFWHTIVAGALAGLGTTLLLKLASTIPINLFGKNFNGSYLILLIILTIATQLVFTAFAKKWAKKLIAQPGGKIISFGLGALVSAGLIGSLPGGQTFTWVGFAISLGWIVHILGDTFTTSGTPLLWPLPWKGHLWWNHRFPPYLTAGGAVEKIIVIPLFLILCAISIMKILVL